MNATNTAANAALSRSAASLDGGSLRSGTRGPVTARLHRRNFIHYALICVLAYLPTLLKLSPAWQAAGLGLLLPGAGFIATGGWWALLLPVTLVVFWLSVIAWFWAGMVVAPLSVWLGAAALAGALTGESIWPPALYLAPASMAVVYLYMQYRGAQRRKKDQELYKFRQSHFAETLSEVQVKSSDEPVPGTRELSAEDLASVRYIFERALQPLDQFKGFTIIDQFQPAALRYQLNHMGFALGLMQCHYTPNFHGYSLQAQRNLIDKYLQPKVLNYWILESMWGHFNFTDHDPVVRDNIMLSGWYSMHVGQYMLNSGDRRYSEPGSLAFHVSKNKVYKHDFHTMAQAVASNFEKNRFTLFPCEPNWVYAVCNMYGMSGLVAHDAVHGTHYTRDILPAWMEKLETEFTDLKGSLVPLRSKWTGIELPFYSGEAGFAFFANIFSTRLAQRLWAVGRKELGFCLAPDAEGKTRLTLPLDQLAFIDKIDPGHYKPGLLFAYVAVMMSAQEFGDTGLAEACIRSMDQDCGRTLENGVLSYRKGSCLANVWGVAGRLMRTGDYRNSFAKGPPATALSGPVLADCKYPDVLVSKAFSHRGDDLELVLYPGEIGGQYEIGIERLKAGAIYTVTGARPTVVTADAQGKARLTVDLRGRTPVSLEPQTLH